MMTTAKQFSDILSEWTGVLMRRSMRDFMRIMKDTGLSMSQLGVLIRLYFQQECGISDIGSHLGVSNPAASQLVERLVQQGLLDRSEDLSDRRAKQIRLTAKGRLLIEEHIEARRRWMEELTTTLSREEQESIIRALTLLNQAAHDLDSAAHPQPASSPTEEKISKTAA
ncbi:MAG: MarR family transcriptional regulator [Chloroflexota bacterium]|nr:MAG: MarR family transcriptional regulator [Chloroflexota bacterium]